MQVSSNIFDSPATTGPGKFGRRLAAALAPLGIQMLPAWNCHTPDIHLANALMSGHIHPDVKRVLRLDGPGAGTDIFEVETAHKSADVVIYQSEFSKGVLQDRHDFIPDKSYVIHNGVPMPSMTKRGAGMNFEPRLLSICHNWNEHRYPNYMKVVVKNWLEVREAWRERYDGREQDIVWGIAGNSHEFESAIKALGIDPLKHGIVFNGFYEDLSQLREWATVALHIVPNDSCPNSVIESLSCGLPCIVWHDSAGPELIGEHAGETLYSPHAIELSDAIHRIHAHYDSYVACARQQAETHLDINHVAEKYAEVFLNAVS